MHVTSREGWAAIHGMILGVPFLLAFAGGLAGLYSLRPELLTTAGVVERTRRLALGVWVMAGVAWLAVISGTWIVYPWYRAETATSPKTTLLADPNTAQWHEFGMEWKEHVAWIAPLLATAVAFAVTYYGRNLIKHDGVRKLLMGLFIAAFVAAGVAGIMGAFITKVAPIK